MLLYYIWFRFIRVRMPRDIPFSLNFFLLIILLLICFVYFYSIFKAIKIYKHLWYNNDFMKDSTFINLLLPYMSLIIRPLIMLDNAIKQNDFFKQYYKTLLIKMTLWWESYITKIHKLLPASVTHYRYDISNNILYVFWNILPKTVTLIILCLDIFYFNKLHYTYMFLYISIIPLIGSYFFYSVKIALEEYLVFPGNLVSR